MSLPKVQLRRGVASDIDAIVNLERVTSHAPHWPRATYADMLAVPPDGPAGEEQKGATQRCVFVSVTQGIADESVIGFAVGLMHLLPASRDHAIRDNSCGEEATAELESVAVAASARRAGIGRALCLAVIGWARSLGASEVVLEVRARSADAIGLYTVLGFTQIGCRQRYYHDPDDDALVMRLCLDRSEDRSGYAR